MDMMTVLYSRSGAPKDHEVEEQGNDVEGYAKDNLQCPNLQQYA